jgi:hypothetical protein
MDADGLFVSALLRRGSVTHLRAVNPMYLSEAWKPVHGFIVQFVQAHHALPHPITIEQVFPGLRLPDAPEEVAFYAGRVRDNAMRVAMEKGLVESVAQPLAEHRPQDALTAGKQVLAAVSREFLRETHRGLVIDANQDIAARAKDYELRKRSQHALGLPLFLPTMTRGTGGMMPGEVWVFLARPNMGKTWAAVAQSVFLYQSGFRVLFVSQETPPQNPLPKDPAHRVVHGVCIRCQAINPNTHERCEAALTPRQRLTVRFDSLSARVCALRNLKGLLNPVEERQLFQYYEMAGQPGRWGWGNYRIVSPPYVNGVADVEMEALEFCPDLVVWDSPYLSVAGSGEDAAGANEKGATDKNRKARVDQLVIDIKRMVERLGIPGLLTWHFNRDVDEKATGASYNDCALSDEVGRVFDVLVGLYRPREIKDAFEGLWQVLKVRDGSAAVAKFKSFFRVEDAIRFDEIGPYDR